MNLIIGLLWLLTILSGFLAIPVQSHKKVVLHSQPDTANAEFVLIEQPNGLYHYQQHFITPVCATGECKPVELTLTFDALGKYVSYKPAAERPFTKYDHTPFSQADYQKLHYILQKENSALKKYKLKELLGAQDPTNNDIDAHSGATIEAISNDVVPAAVYTTHTLWHIVHGWRSQAIAKHADTLLSHHNIPALLKARGKPHYNQKALELWTTQLPNDTTQYLANFAQQVNSNNYFFALQVFNALTPAQWRQPQWQQVSFNGFKTFNYQLQLQFLGHLKNTTITDTNAFADFILNLEHTNAKITEITLKNHRKLILSNKVLIQKTKKLTKTQNKGVAQTAKAFLKNNHH